tara:strand:- start:238 stop:438 length:201 start_codon:yes stop_codon:yes gene_type:complete
MITTKRTPKKTGRKRRKGQYTSSPSNMEKEIAKLKKNQEKIIATINTILVDMDKSKLQNTPEGMYT